jgi:hypothetical protein
MSDRVRTQSVEFSQDCPNCVVTPTGYEFCAAHLAALRGERKNNNRSVSSPAAPVEPPVLSRASIDENEMKPGDVVVCGAAEGKGHWGDG